MRVETIEKKLYKFEELSDGAKAKALEAMAESESEHFDCEFVYDDAENMAKILGIDLAQTPVKLMGGGTRYDPTIYYSGFYSQGDGACFEGHYSYAKGCKKAIREYAGVDKELHRIADELTALQRKFFYSLCAAMRHSGHYYHSGCMEVEVTDNVGTGYGRVTDEAEEALTQLMRDFADWIYKQLESEYEYRTGKEACTERATDCEMEFEEDGTIDHW